MNFRSMAAILAATVAIPFGAAQAADLEVTHWWTSGGEAAAVAELAKAFDATGNKWIDGAIAGSGGTARPIMVSRITGGDPMGATQFNHGRSSASMPAPSASQRQSRSSHEANRHQHSSQQACAGSSSRRSSVIFLQVGLEQPDPTGKTLVTAFLLHHALGHDPTCSTDSLRDTRDRAILMVAFASGGRRRSEIAGLRTEQFTVEPPITVDGGPPLPSLAIHLGRTKTSGSDHDEVVYLTGRPVDALNVWLAAGRIDGGSVFRKIDRWGNVSKRALEPSAINDIVKHRAEMAGFDSREFSAHGLRSGYLTEAANRGISLPEAMEQSRHRSVQQASSYYNNATRRSGRAAQML